MTGPGPLFLEVEGQLDGQTALPLVGELLPADDGGPLTLECDECGEKFTGPRGGKGSATFLLGKHRYSKHGVRKDGARRPARSAKSADVIEPDGTLVSTLHEAAQQVTGTGTPSAKALASAFGYLANTATLTAAGWAVDSDPLIQAQLEHPDPNIAGTAEAQRNALVAALTLDAKQAAQIAAPIARILQPTSLNKRYGRAVVDNTDLGPALAAVLEIGRNWQGFLAVRRQHVRALKAAQAPAPAVPLAAVPAPPLVPPTVPAPPVAGPLGAGVVAQPSHR